MEVLLSNQGAFLSVSIQDIDFASVVLSIFENSFQMRPFPRPASRMICPPFSFLTAILPFTLGFTPLPIALAIIGDKGG